MRIGVDAREAFRAQPRGIGVYTRNLTREFAALAPDDEFLLYHQLELPEGADDPYVLGANQRAVQADMPGGRSQLCQRPPGGQSLRWRPARNV